MSRGRERAVGRLRTRTGIDFDLPSEAQWEFAARAGNGDTKWGDGSAILNASLDENLGRLGRYKENGGLPADIDVMTSRSACGATNGTAIVGSYAPNAWGLYDMFGNVCEMCHDWFETDEPDNVTSLGGNVNVDPANPKLPLSGKKEKYLLRVARGGGYNKSASECRPAYRSQWQNENSTCLGEQGIRLVCTAGLK